ncbi:MAG: ribonuclease HII [Bacteroidetes bacterium]|nr:ribonuclease HII [Bacteroidota bacterium]
MLEKYFQKKRLEAGCDEAGRGCLAGPVFAAAVIIPNGIEIEGLNDSKLLTKKKRQLLRPIIEKQCIWAVAQILPKEIDKINILNASIKAMQLALQQLYQQPQYIIIDGNRFKPYGTIPYTTIVKGDGKYLSIAAASILAKTHRDEHMEKLSKQFPEYKWHKNKGYPTKEHREAIKLIGPCKHHRMSFTLLPSQLVLF